ncbi:MAG: hypothetical protein AAF715_29645 [Myxococcota bacterium]
MRIAPVCIVIATAGTLALGVAPAGAQPTPPVPAPEPPPAAPPPPAPAAPAPIPKAPVPIPVPPRPAPPAGPAAGGAPRPKASSAVRPGVAATGRPEGTPITPRPDRRGAEPALPPGHPPVGGPSGRPTPDALRKMIEARKNAARGGRPTVDGTLPAAPASAPPRVKAPRDEHGMCLGDSHNDRPKDINLFHGWLGVNNEKAEPAPSPKGSTDWWKWRLTPYPYRYENHDDHCDARNQPIPLLANVINIAALLFLLARFGRRPLREALEKRRASIMAEMDRAKEIKKSARARLRKYEEELEHLDDRRTGLREQYAAEGEVEERNVRQEMAETRERLLADAAFRISQEQKTARDALSRQALEEALQAAERLLVREVSDADHDRLEAEYLDQLADALDATVGTGGAAGGGRRSATPAKEGGAR